MKKIICLLLIIFMILPIFVACQNQRSSDKTSIVVSIFPIYDWVKNILADKADNFEITVLLDNGIDLHSYKPSASDIVKISNADLFIYVGGESDEWVEDTFKSIGKTVNSVALLETLGERLIEEELKEGMEGHDEPENDGDEEEYDEHIWLSLKNAKILCSAIEEKIELIDSANKEDYKSNKDEYLQKLDTLDKKYEEAVKNGNKNTLIFGDRFPFVYLANDYKLDYYAAFSGCSAESEASFETITFLSTKAKELKVKYIIKLDTSDGKIAKTIAENAGLNKDDVLSLNSMQSITKSDIKNGADYLNIMENNLNILIKAME